MILVCGIPNAGKTSYSQRYGGVIHYDALRMTTRERHAYIREAAKTEGVCVEGVFGERKRRAEFVKAAHEAGCEAVCIWMDTPVDTCLERERNGRKRGGGLVLHHSRMFEPPTPDEGWDEIRIVRRHT